MDILEMAWDLARRSRHQITSSEKKLVLDRMQNDPRAPSNIRQAHFFRVLQKEGLPLTFRILGKSKQRFRPSDKAYLQSLFRRELKLEGIPIQLEFRM